MNIEDFLSDVSLDAPGCPDFLAKKYITHALRDFCERTKAWQQDLDEITLLEGQPSYDIDVPVDSEIVVLLSAMYDGSAVDIRSPEEMDRILTTWRTDTGVGLTYLINDRDTVYVSPIPTADDTNTVTIRAALKPTLTATTCSDILDNWREGIAAGALYRLKAMPGKQWSDREGAAHYLSVFEAAKRNARIRVLNGFTERTTAIIPQVY